MQSFENTIKLDGRAYQTIKYFSIRTGFLSLEFIEGKIRSYVHPMKMYMFLSAIFFTLIFFMFSHIDVYEKFNIGNYEQFIIDSFKAEDQRDTLIKKEIGSTKLSVIDNTKDTSAIKGIKSTDSTEMKRKSNIIYREAFSTLSKYTPILLLLLIPVFGWLYYLSYRKRIKFYISHIVFSFHIHSFLLILITICIVLYNYFNVPYVFLLAFIIFIIYNVMATMMFYNKTAGKAIIRTLLLLTIYFIVLICVYSMCIIYIAANIYNDIMEGLI